MTAYTHATDPLTRKSTVPVSPSTVPPLPQEDPLRPEDLIYLAALIDLERLGYNLSDDATRKLAATKAGLYPKTDAALATLHYSILQRIDHSGDPRGVLQGVG